MAKHQISNPAPTYLYIYDLLSKDFADILIGLVEGYGEPSKQHEGVMELQLRNPFNKDPREYDLIGFVVTELYNIAEKGLRLVNWNFLNTVCNEATGYHGFWVTKYEEGVGTELYCNWNSSPGGIHPPVVATLNIPLNEDFAGGELILNSSDRVMDVTFFKGNNTPAVLYDGFTSHKIRTVTKGTKYSLIIHYTGTIK